VCIYIQFFLPRRELIPLSFPTGDYDGLGEVRRKEVKGSCDTLGVSTDRCVVMEHRDLQDNPKKWWDEAIVESMLKRYVDSWHIDLVRLLGNGTNAISRLSVY
jgi:N-acetylglucosaminylphosphatidylinositol deacetylase